MGNEDVGNMTDPTKATEWVNENIKAYLPATKIKGIAVGNEEIGRASCRERVWKLV